MKNVLFWILVAMGEAIIITCFLILGAALPGDVLALDIVVTSLLFGIMAYSVAAPAIRLDDKSGKQAAGLGISWLGSTLYSLAAVVTVVAGIIYCVHFRYQLLVQIILLFMYLVAVLTSLSAAAKAGKVHAAEQVRSVGIRGMRDAVALTADEARLSAGVPSCIVSRLDSIAETLRYTSPSSAPQATDLEKRFIGLMEDIRRALTDYGLNAGTVEEKLNRAALLADNRSRILS